MSNPERLSLHALAQLAGCTKAAVLKATRTGRLHRGDDGKVALDDGDTRLFIEQIRLRHEHEIGRVALDAQIETRRLSAGAEEAPEQAKQTSSVVAPSSSAPFPALTDQEIDVRAPAILDCLDGLQGGYRVGLVPRDAVVNLVQGAYSLLMGALTNKDDIVADPYALAGTLSQLFKDWTYAFLDTDLDAALYEADIATREIITRFKRERKLT
jgi:hypothetical protein